MAEGAPFSSRPILGQPLTFDERGVSAWEGPGFVPAGPVPGAAQAQPPRTPVPGRAARPAQKPVPGARPCVPVFPRARAPPSTRPAPGTTVDVRLCPGSRAAAGL